VRGQELYKIGDRVVAGGQPLYGDPRYPVYDVTVYNKLLHTSSGNRDIIWLNDQQLMCFRPIGKGVLNKSVAGSPADLRSRLIGWGKLNIQEKPLWQYSTEGSVAFARTENAILVAGTRPRGAAMVEAIDVKTGEQFSKFPKLLPAPPVRWGMAVDGTGCIVISLEGGELVCYGPAV
jgi:hypothetical protein